MSRKEKVKVFKIILLSIVLIISVGVIIYLFPVMKNLSTIEGQEAFKKKWRVRELWECYPYLDFKWHKYF